MSVCLELELDGSQREWQLEEGVCPRCGDACEIHIPVTPDTPHRLFCSSCNYEEGFNPLEYLFDVK